MNGVSDSLVEQTTCPFCGSVDSFIYSQEQKKMFLCHDCQRHLPASNIPQEQTKVTYSKISYNSLLTLCTKVTELPDDHFCKVYVRQRGIPPQYEDILYFTKRFDEIASTIDKETDNSPRLVIPFFDNEGNMFAMQGRAFESAARTRYMTLVFDDNIELLYGTDRVDLSKDFIVVEGPLDSLFLPNAIASAGVSNISDKYLPNAVVCLDNEPRNKDIVRAIKKNLDRGFKVVIWPDHIQQKDINDMVMAGIDVQNVINNNTHNGLLGIVKLNSWKKI